VNRSKLDSIVSDCIAVMAKVQSMPDPLSRIDYLHTYAVLLNLTIELQAEQSELQILGGAWETEMSGTNPTDWWNSLSAGERNSITANVKYTKQQRTEALLRSGLLISFADEMRGMDAGSLQGGTPGISDFEMGRDLQFSELEYFPEGGSASWIYYVGRDPQGHCSTNPNTVGPTSSPREPRAVPTDHGSM